MAQHAFVLGGTGQIGRAVTGRLLETGWDVTVAARHEPELPVETRFVRLDRTVDGELEHALDSGVDVLVDVIPLRAEDGRQLRRLQGQVGSMVVISTAGVYADAEGRTFADPEAAYPRPVSERQRTVEPGGDDYHSIKRTIELVVLADTDLRATVVRPCAIHGPHAKRAREWYFVKRALDGRRVVILAHRGSGRFHTTSVDNLAEVVRLAAQRPGSRVVNCGDPEPPTVVEIARAVGDAVNVEWTEVLLPGSEQGSVGEHPWNIPRPFVLDMTTAEVELAYRPVVRYAAAVRRTVDWLVKTHPDATEYGSELFDYGAEDAYLRSLS
jgi:nucleoside-diphosphate-sugar epimerase